MDVIQRLWICGWLTALPLLAAGPEVVPQTGHSEALRQVAFSPDGSLLATAGRDRAVLLWDVATGAVRRRLIGHTGEVRALAFSPDGRLLASAGDDRTIILRDPESGAVVRWIEAEAPVTCLAYSPDGACLAAGNMERRTQRWDVATGQEGAALHGHTHVVTGVAFMPDGRTLVTGSLDGSVRFWDPSGNPPRVLPAGSAVKGIALSTDGHLLATAGASVRLWDALTGASRGTPGDAELPAECARFSPDGTLLATGGANGAVQVWSTADRRLVRTLDASAGTVAAVAFSADGKLLAAGTNHAEARVWETAGGLRQVLASRAAPLRAVATSADGRLLLAGGDDGRPRLWNLAEAAMLPPLPGTGAVRCAAFSPDGSLAASGGTDRQVHLWDTATGNEVFNVPSLAGWVEAVAFDPSGQRLAYAGADGVVRLLAVPSGQELSALSNSPTTWVEALAWSPDGKLLAAGGFGGLVTFWDPRKAAAVRSFRPHDSTVTGLAFAPDGGALVTAGADGAVRRWAIPGLDPAPPLLWGERPATGLALGGGRMLAGGDDGVAVLRDLSAANPPVALEGHGAAVTAVAGLADGALFATAGKDGAVRLWDGGGGLRATLYGLGDDWLAVTADGAYSGSADGVKSLRAFPADPLQALRRPEEVVAALRSLGTPVPAPALDLQADLPAAGSADPVVVRLTVTPADPAAGLRRADVLLNGQRLDLPVTATGPAGVCSFCGRPVTIQAADTPNGAVVFTLTLAAQAGPVTLTATAWDLANRRGEALPRVLGR